MSRRLLTFPGFSLEVSSGWADITEELPGAQNPLTLARSKDGVGALQFSPALYRSGKLPNPSTADLAAMVEEFGQSHGLGEPFDREAHAQTVSVAAGSFCSGGDFMRLWYASDGRGFMVITYICEWGGQSQELAECEQIVGSIRFAS